MLVISQNLVLSPADAAISANTPAILYDDLVTFSNVTADSEEADYPATNLANESTNQEWRAASATDVEITLAVNAEVSGVALIRHNCGSANIAFSVGYYAAGPTWVELTAPQIPPNDEPLLAIFTLQSIAEVVIRLTEGDEAARAAVAMCGPLLRLPRGYDIGPDFTPPRFARRREVHHPISQRGDYLGEITTSEWIQNAVFQFKHFDPEWYRTYFDPFLDATRGRAPFVYAWAAEDYPYEVSYCWHGKDVIPLVSPVTGRHSFTLDLMATRE